ncbi:hypothetical protein [Aquimarina algicola]|uniref:hypothetical protein n=1 Tax=Aquimarina algicola TaxID=2589995 RepID=UPI001CF38A12|nr:hypothetical protein [Aquimarina algicola]
MNPNNKKPILYIDEVLPRTPEGKLFPSDQSYINKLKSEGIEVVNSLEELIKLIK